jgi:hypothetical protein
VNRAPGRAQAGRLPAAAEAENGGPSASKNPDFHSVSINWLKQPNCDARQCGFAAAARSFTQQDA